MTVLIERAIESAKCRQYRVIANKGESLAHQMRAENQLELQRVTIEALEKQIPKKPKQSGVTDKNGVFHKINGIEGVPYDLCPNCETNLCTDGRLGRKKEGFNYCMNCGQALKWGEEDD